MFTSSRLSAEEVTPAAAPLRRSSERHRRRVGEQRLRLTAELYSRSQPLSCFNLKIINFIIAIRHRDDRLRCSSLERRCGGRL